MVLFTITIHFLNTLTASSATVAAHHTSRRTDIANALNEIQAARPRLDTATEASTAILVAFSTAAFRLFTRTLLNNLAHWNFLGLLGFLRFGHIY
jgi:hypothetical protein